MNESPQQPNPLGASWQSGPDPTQPSFGGPQQWGSYSAEQNKPGPRPPMNGGSFFQSIRNSGWFRAENRIIGGVCAGISAKTGWDLALVRALTVILALIAIPVLALYAVAWMLLPEQVDGRIHLESLIHGRWDVAQLGAIFLFVVSVPVVSLTFSAGSDMLVLFALLGFTVVVACAVILIVQISKGADPTTRPSPRFQAPPRNVATPTPSPLWSPPTAQAPTSPVWQQASQSSSVPDQPVAASPDEGQVNASTQPDTTRWREVEQPPAQQPAQTPTQEPPQSQVGPVGSLTPGAASATPGNAIPKNTSPFVQPTPAWGWNGQYGNAWNTTAGPQFQPSNSVWIQPTLPPQRKPVSAAISAMVLGLVLIVLSVTFTFMWASSENNDSVFVARSAMVGGAACLIIVGTAISWAAIKDRSAGWLSVLAAIGVCLALPTGIVGVSTLNIEHYRATDFSSYVDAQTKQPVIYDWKVNQIGPDASNWAVLDLTDAPQYAAQNITVEAYMDRLTIKVEEGQHVIIRSKDPYSINQLLTSNKAAVSMGWVPNLAQWQDQRGSIKMPDSTLDNAIQVVLNSSVNELTIEQVTDSHQRLAGKDSPQSGVQDAPQSGSVDDTAQSGMQTRSGAPSTPKPSASANSNISFERSTVTTGVNHEH